MKVIMHDLDEQYNERIMVKCDELIHATGEVCSLSGLLRLLDETSGRMLYERQSE